LTVAAEEICIANTVRFATAMVDLDVMELLR
jgi:hypothetical protein